LLSVFITYHIVYKLSGSGTKNCRQENKIEMTSATSLCTSTLFRSLSYLLTVCALTVCQRLNVNQWAQIWC